MKIYVEHEVSDDEKYCSSNNGRMPCAHYSYTGQCSLFRSFLDRCCKTHMFLKCERCLSAPKKVCKCAEKKKTSYEVVEVDFVNHPYGPTC